MKKFQVFLLLVPLVLQLGWFQPTGFHRSFLPNDVGNATTEVSAISDRTVASSFQSETTYFVDSEMGLDSNPGTIELPFRSISRAVEMVAPGDVVYLRAGTYRETVSMHKDGTLDTPITFRQYNNEHVVISGAVKVTDWSGPSAQGIYSATVPASIDLSPETYQVFVNGRMVPQAREPEINDPDDPFSQQWFPIVKGVAVNIQAANGQWLRAVDGGGSHVFADSDSLGAWEEFYLFNTSGAGLKSGHQVGFVTSDHRHYLTAENGGRPIGEHDILVANRDEFQSWQQFTIGKVASDSPIVSGDMITLRAEKDGYLSADRINGNCGGGAVHANGNAVGECEEFRLAIHPDGVTVNIQSAGGQWLRAIDRGGAEVLFDATSPGLWEEYSLIDMNGGALMPGDKVGFLTYDRVHYLTAENGGRSSGLDDILSANREEVGSWEKFTILKLMPDGTVDEDADIGSGDTVAFRSEKEGYISADQIDGVCGGDGLHANADAIGECEKFTLTIYPEQLALFDESVVDFDGSDNGWQGSYIWGPFGDKWALNMAKIVGSNPGELIIGETDEWWSTWGWTHGQAAIIGGRGALDSSNEWYFEKRPDAVGGILYFKPEDGKEPSELTIEMRNHMWSVDVEGSHIVLDGLDFFAGQVRLLGNGNVLNNVKVIYGTHFLFSETISESTGADQGRNGVFIKGDDNVVSNSEIAYSAGSGIVLEGDRNIVRNCLIHDFGYMGTVTSGVKFIGTESVLTQSTLFNSGRDILHLGQCSKCKITFNLLHDSTLLTNDSGVIYSFGYDLQGTEIAYNWIHGITDPQRQIGSIHLGIYLDNGSRNVFVHHNLISGLANKPGVGPNTPHEGHLICNNTILHDNFIPTLNTPRFDEIGVGSVCSCDFDRNTGLPDPFYWKNHSDPDKQCRHEPEFNPQSSWCACYEREIAEREDGDDRTNFTCEDFWMSAENLRVLNTKYYYTFAEAQADLLDPQAPVFTENGWMLADNPDFRPKAESSLVDVGRVCDPGTNDFGWEIPAYSGQLPDLGAYEYNGIDWIPGYSPVPLSVHDRYDVAKDRTLYIGPSGVLGNDLAATGNPRVFYSEALEQDIVELGWDRGSWHALDLSSGTGPVSDNLASVSVDGQPRVYYGHEMLCAYAGYGDNLYEATWLEDENRWIERDIWAELPGAKCEHTVAKTSPIRSVAVNGNPRVYFLGPDQHVHELAWVTDSWYHRDLTQDASAPVSAPGALAVTTITNDDPRVYYLTPDGHIHELAWRSLTRVWYHRDITANVGGSPALGGLLSATTANLEPRVYYLAADRHIHEIAWFSNRWHWRDLTQAVETDANVALPPVVEDSPLDVMTVGERGDPRVYYLGAGSKGLHVQELAWLGDRWSYLDVTEAVDEAPAAANDDLAVVHIDSKPYVYYVDADEHVHQLAWDNEWLHMDVTAAIGDTVLYDYPTRISATTANDVDLVAKLVTDVEYGDLTLYEDGSFVYTPQAGFTGRDRFSYVASTGMVDSAEATVELDVTDECAPVDGNLVRNFCFADGKEEWKFYHGDQQGSFGVSSDDSFAGEQSAQVTVRGPGRNVQFYQTGIALEPRTRYELSFAAYSSGGEDMKLYIHKHRWPYSNYGLRAEQVDLEPYWKVFTLTFTTPNRSDMDNARLRFWLAPFAQADTVYHIDRVMLRALDDVQDIVGAASQQFDAIQFVDIEEDGLLAGAEVPDAMKPEGVEFEEIERLFLPFIRQ